MHLQQALEAFLLQLEADGRSVLTIGQYRRHCTELADWLVASDESAETANLTPQLVARFFADDRTRRSRDGGPKKASSLNSMRTSIRCFAAYLHDAGMIATNPARMLRRARCSAPPPRPLHPDEQQRLLRLLRDATGRAAERDRMLIELLLSTGIRIGSAIQLDIEDLDFEHGEIILRKTKNDRPAVAVVPRSTTATLQTWLGDRRFGPVFESLDRRMSTRQAQRRITLWFQRAGIEGRTAHSLRHSFATDLLARTGDLRLVQAAMHHASIVSTTVYAAVEQRRLRAALGAERAPPVNLSTSAVRS